MAWPPEDWFAWGFANTFLNPHNPHSLPERTSLSTSQIKVPTHFVSIAIIIWGALLSILFLKSNAHTFAKLATPTRATYATAADNTQLLYSICGVAVAVLILLSWYGLGDLLTRLFPQQNEDLLWGRVRRTAWGAGLWSLVWLGFGAAGLYKGVTAAASVVLGLTLLSISLRLKSEEAKPHRSTISRVIFALLFLLSLLALLSSLAPPTAKDTLLYHFSLPKAYIAAGGLVEVPYNIAGYLPLGAEMHSVWAMLTGGLIDVRVGEAAAGATQFAFYPLLLAAIYSWAKEHVVDTRWAAMAALAVGAAPTVYYVAANAYVDVALALYITLAIRAAALWWVRQDRWSLAAGLSLALGFALCIKLIAAFLALPLIILVLLKANSLQKSGASTRALCKAVFLPLAALFLAGLLASPWYTKTWSQTGSPLFPFYLNIWNAAAPGWDVERSVMFQFINSTYGGYPKTPFDYLLVPFRLSTAAQPEDPKLFDGVLGASFLLGLPVLFWSLWSSRLNTELKIAAALSGALFIFWLFSSQQLRYLLPALPALAVAIASSVDSLCAVISPRLRWPSFIAFACTTITALLISIAWFASQNPIPVIIGREARRDYLSRQLDYFPYYEIINNDLPTTARVWLINMRRDTYHLGRSHFSDYTFEDYTLKKFVDQADSAADLTRLVSDTGITHILIRHDVLLDYSRSPIVDEGLAQQDNLKKMAILRSFLVDQNKVLRRDGRFMLVEVAD